MASAKSCVYGRLALGALLVTVISGVGLGALYDPGAPLDSLERIQAGVPWAWLLRAVHWMAGTALLVLGLVHLLEMVRQKRERSLGPAVWWRSVLLLPLLLLAMLGGFVLRGDAEALSALAVWRGVLASLPLLGPLLDRLLLGAGVDAMGVVLLHHAGTFTLAIWLFSAEHGGRLWPDRRWGVVAAGLALAAAAFIPVGLGAPPPGGAAAHLGPWYLLGLQGALVDLPVQIGWLAPLLLLAGVGSLAHLEGRGRRAVLWILSLSLLLYLGWTVRILLLLRGAGA